MLTGRLPFIANTAAELSQMHRSVAPQPLSQINPEIPLNLEEACLKVLSKESSLRYRTADQFGRVLISLSRSNNIPINKAPSLVKPAISETANAPAMQSSAVTQTQPVLASNSQPAHQEQPSPEPLKPRVKSSATITPARNAVGNDWGTWALVILMVITLGGLIPLWIWIYFLYNPPGR